MTTIARKLTSLNFFSRQRRHSSSDLKSLSDRSLQDIGFKYAPRDLDAVKPFWMA